ncbi:hypothetical protein B0T18DRAFT_91038 [Schizothecium vesticola]|uniref:Uncharacterized protein n=1 Tax=Schizothecium vesticola TaxID=314040 RepID=A0AA40F769_9PEZI|nr:hypothetical protein B0T18DRAFT_91038 [Schizothecium vesticola]
MGNCISRISRNKDMRRNPAEFNPVMKFINTHGPNRNRTAVALLDTQCPTGLWITQRLVNEMGMSASVSPCPDPPAFRDANGNPFTACGFIELTWMWQDPAGARTYTYWFYIFSTDLDRQVDVVIGRDVIQHLELVNLRRESFLILGQHKKPQEKGEWFSFSHALILSCSYGLMLSYSRPLILCSLIISSLILPPLVHFPFMLSSYTLTSRALHVFSIFPFLIGSLSVFFIRRSNCHCPRGGEAETGKGGPS